MPNLNAVLKLIAKRLDQGVTFKKVKDVLKNYVLNNNRKEEYVVEIITDVNNPDTNFDTKHMPDDLIEK